MAAQSFSIDFDGYWREENKSSIPSKSGIYCVYSCTHNEAEKKVSLSKLIYVGEAADANGRISNHERLPDWKKHLSKGEQLCYSFGAIGGDYRERCEAAIIFKHKPPENTEYVNAFPFDETTMSLAGKTAKLQTSFTVKRT